MANLTTAPPLLLLLVSIFLVITTLPLRSLAQTLFVFGDGLYDAGNKQYLSDKPVPANSPPYGVTVGKATGRWSDGDIIPDFLATFIGIPKVDPILDPNGNFAHGASFATADATVLGAPPQTMTFVAQVLKFSQNKNKWTDGERSKALYLIYIGADDYLNFTKNNPNPSEEQKQSFTDQVVASMQATINALYRLGARKFALQNLPPLGCLPIVKQGSESGEECVKLPSEMAATHNTKLLQTLRKLAQDLKGFQYSLYDYYSSIQRRVVDSKTYQMETANIACCGTGSHSATGCSTSNVCGKPSEYLFFDGKHLTEAANQQTAHLIFSADPAVISPNNLRELLVLPLDVPVIFGVQLKTQSVSELLEDRTKKIHSSYDVESMDWGLGSAWSTLQIDGGGSASAFYM